MLTCVPLWAILVTQCGQSWAFYTQLTELPTYMSQILHFDIQQVRWHCQLSNTKNILLFAEFFIISHSIFDKLVVWHPNQHLRGLDAQQRLLVASTVVQNFQFNR